MGTRQTGQKRRAKSDQVQPPRWTSLTWDDLEQWAGSRSVSRGESYQGQGRVQDLVVGQDGRLLATVIGGERYTTMVWLEGAKQRSDSIHSECTCPIGSACKHAVAVVLAYLEALASEKTVPTADPEDPRWALAGSEEDDADWDSEDEEIDDPTASNVEEDVPEDVPKRGKRGQKTRVNWTKEIERFIRSKSHDELVELVLSLLRRYSELREEFKEQVVLDRGDVRWLMGQARREMEKVVSERGWQNSWSNDGYIPDYSRFKRCLEQMIQLGHSDAVVKLGGEFLPRAMEQIEESQDEGETAEAVRECMSIVFDAVLQSSLPVPEKILFAIDACMADDYDITEEPVEQVLDHPWKPADWSVVADTLQGRFQAVVKGTADTQGYHKYRRNEMSNWLGYALERAGREEEILGLYEAEARVTDSYPRLVQYLIAHRQYDDAERWAREGIEATSKELPGIAVALADSLCELAGQRKQWDVVASHAAWKFFESPAVESFKELLRQSAKAKCQEQVQAVALRFLETDVPPISVSQSPKGDRILRVDLDWPLPVPDYLIPLLRVRDSKDRTPQPHYQLLLELAIQDNRPDDVLRWYDKMEAEAKQPGGPWLSSCAERVAEAVANSHPERALKIYRERLDANLPKANLYAYEAAAHYLQRMRPIMQSIGCGEEWDALLKEIREKYRNRPRFMETLDRLEGRTILDTKSGRRRRS